jgi:hypothetical protein
MLPIPTATNKQGVPNVIMPGSTLIKCVDGVWSDRDGASLPSTPLLAIGTAKAVQRFADGEGVIDAYIERPDKPLPDPEKLNSKIPMNQWEIGADGKPRKPYSLFHVAYLLNPISGDTYTFSNNSLGAELAVERLANKLPWMRQLRGNVYPLVELDHRPMKTRFGVKQRPEFTVLEWRELIGGGTIEAPKEIDAPQIEHQPAPEPKQEQTGFDKYAAIKKAGKDVKPVTSEEALDDEIPQQYR